jgi:ABC-type cobalamin/Fe3+-siderophores transport system ATPase subunit
MKVLFEQLDKAYAVAIREKDLARRKKELEEKRKLLEEKVKEPILKEFPQWQKEERQLSKLQRDLDTLLREVVEPLEKVRVEDYFGELEPGTPNGRDIAALRESLFEVGADIQNAAKVLKQALHAKAKSLQTFIGDWRRKFEKAKQKHEEVIKSAGVKNAPALTSELNRATEAIERLQRELEEAKKAARKTAALESELRGSLMPDYNTCFAQIYKKRLDKAAGITGALDGFVRIQVRQMADRGDFEEALTAAARGSGLRKPVLQQIAAKLTPLELAQYIVDKNSRQLAEKARMNEESASVLIDRAWSASTTEDGNVLLSRLYHIGFTELRDQVLVELRVDGQTYKPMHELSVGSKCTAILSVALVEGGCPLIVDQPEDALDNPFVFEQIVQTVRRTKAARQYIFATHNSNVAVASDADLIYCLKATASQGSIDKHGSIDQVSTRDRIMANLEGGKDAFRLRSQKYDVVVKDANAVVLDLPSVGQPREQQNT